MFLFQNTRPLVEVVVVICKTKNQIENYFNKFMYNLFVFFYYYKVPSKFDLAKTVDLQ